MSTKVVVGAVVVVVVVVDVEDVVSRSLLDACEVLVEGVSQDVKVVLVSSPREDLVMLVVVLLEEVARRVLWVEVVVIV